MENTFLAQFLKMRESLNKDIPTSKNPHTSGAAFQKQQKHVSMATIIEDLPSKAVVLQYLRDRIADMEESDCEDA
jgi:hypothetical protein